MEVCTLREMIGVEDLGYSQGRNQGVPAGAMASPMMDFFETPLLISNLTPKFIKIYIYGPLQVI